MTATISILILAHQQNNEQESVNEKSPL